MSEPEQMIGRGSALRGLLLAAVLLPLGAPLWVVVPLLVFYCGPYVICRFVRREMRA